VPRLNLILGELSSREKGQGFANLSAFPRLEVLFSSEVSHARRGGGAVQEGFRKFLPPETGSERREFECFYFVSDRSKN